MNITPKALSDSSSTVIAGDLAHSTERRMEDEVPNKWMELTVLILGAGLACGSVLLAAFPLAALNTGIAGMLIAAGSLATLYRYARWTEWSNVALGCWTALAPLLLGLASQQALLWTHVTVGVSIASIAIGQLTAGRAEIPIPETLFARRKQCSLAGNRSDMLARRTTIT